MEKLPRPHPDRARQKIYSEKFDKGCRIVSLYNHTSRYFTVEEIARLRAVSRDKYSDIPWQTEFGKPVGYILAIDVTDTEITFNLYFEGDNTLSSNQMFPVEELDPFESVIASLAKFAEEWRGKDRLIEEIDVWADAEEYSW
jgi:hypothetical protein